MGKNLNSVFNEMLKMNLSINIELIKRYASLSIPGFITFEGKDIDANFISQDNIQSFIQDNYSKFEINIEKFKEHIEEIRSKDKSDDTMLDCLKKSDALCYNPEQTTQVLLCTCSTVRKIIFLIKDIIPSEINDNEKALVILIDCALERMLGANDYYAHLIHDSISPFLQKDIEKELKRYKTKKSLLLISYRQMCVSSMSFLSQLFFVSMFVMYLYQEVDGYFNRPKSKESLDVLLETVTKMNAMMVSFAPKIDSIDEKTQQTNSKLDSMGKNTNNEFKGINKKIEQLANNTNNIKNNQYDIKKKQEKTADLVKKRNEEDRPKRLQRARCARCIGRIIEDQFPSLIFKLESIQKTLSRWDKQLENGKKIPVGGYETARHNTIGYFSDWAKIEFIPYYLESRKIKVENNQFSPKKPKRSSEEATSKEAAVEKWNEDAFYREIDNNIENNK